MLDFRQKSPDFDDFRRKGPPPFMKGRERTMLALMALLCVALLIFGYRLVRQLQQQTAVQGPPVGNETSITAMAEPDLSQVPDLPDFAAIKAEATKVAHLLQNPQEVRLSVQGGLSADTIAWARAQLNADRDGRPMPQGFDGAAIVRNQVPIGTAILFDAMLVDLRENLIKGAGPDGGDEPWLNLTVSPWIDGPKPKDPSTVYVHIVAPEWAATDKDGKLSLSPGTNVRVVGRFLGGTELATEAGRVQRTPVVAALSIHEHGEQDVASLMGLPAAQDVGSGSLVVDRTVFDDIDDMRPLLEIRPYYYMLGRVKADAGIGSNVYVDAGNADAASYELHMRPQDFRDRAFIIDGAEVWDAWEDEAVARDMPYGVQRVLRIRMWKQIWGVPHKKEDLEGREQETRAAYYFGYELAVIADPRTPLPRPGDRLRATGRFLKFHGYGLKPQAVSQQISVARQSQLAYFALFVASDFTILPPVKGLDWTVISLIFFAAALGFGCYMVIAVHRDQRRQDTYKDAIRGLRQNRRQWRAALASGASKGAGSPESGQGLLPVADAVTTTDAKAAQADPGDADVEARPDGPAEAPPAEKPPGP